MHRHNIQTIDIEQSDYSSLYHAMQGYTQKREASTHDLIILTEHTPVYTLGPTSQQSDILQQLTDVPYVQTNRGGQITFHGPGQLVVYPLLDLRRLGLKPHAFVSMLEHIIIEVLSQLDISSYNDPSARGIYVTGKKIASIGIRVSKGCSYHGFALNVSTDLKYFNHIHPCGLQAMQMINVNELSRCDMTKIKNLIIKAFKYALESCTQVQIDISPGEDKLILSYEHG